MATGDTASDPFSRSAQNEARRDPSRSRDTAKSWPARSSQAATSPKSTAGHPARTLRKSGRQQHGGSGRYVFLGPDGGHHRRSNYARRLFRPACDGRYEPVRGQPGKVVIADTSVWPGRPVAAWTPVDPLASPPTGLSADSGPPRGRGLRRIADDVPIACWLLAKKGLTPHGLRHSHKTWMEEDGISEILQERRLGHEVPGMRGVYAHVSEAMRTELTKALQTRWEESLRARAAINPHSPVPLLDQLLASNRAPCTQPELFRDSLPSGPAPQPGRPRRQDVPGSQHRNILAS